MGSEGTCPKCGGGLEADTTSGEYGWVCCDTCNYRYNVFTGTEEYEEDDNDQNC